MKATDWKRTVRPLIPPDERWEFRGSLCYRAPASRFLFGVLGEGSGFDTGVYIWRVSMPLFVPSDAVVLSYSQRIGGGSKKYEAADYDELSSAIASGFRDLPTDDDELHRLVEIAAGSPNVRLLEAAVRSQVLLGDGVGALDMIRRATGAPTGSGWEREVISRLDALAKTLDDKGLDDAVQDIDAQVARTATALGVIHG